MTRFTFIALATLAAPLAAHPGSHGDTANVPAHWLVEHGGLLALAGLAAGAALVWAVRRRRQRARQRS